MPQNDLGEHQLPQEPDVDPVRDNLLKLLRLLAKEVAQRLARKTERAIAPGGPQVENAALPRRDLARAVCTAGRTSSGRASRANRSARETGS